MHYDEIEEITLDRKPIDNDLLVYYVDDKEQDVIVEDSNENEEDYDEIQVNDVDHDAKD